MNTRQVLRNLLFLVVLVPFAAPVHAQDMGENGFKLPDFLFSRGEQIARATCINRQPNCRGDVRNQLEIERAVSLIIPWFALAGALTVFLVIRNRAEQKRQAHRRMAQRKHAAGAFRKTDDDEDDNRRPGKKGRDDDDDDRFN